MVGVFLYQNPKKWELIANRIKGITVEIGGDTTGLYKALKGVNSSIRQTHRPLLFLLRCVELGISIKELNLVTIVMVLDIWTEKAMME
ncbi:hypothetical protein KQ873_01415 [Mycoplasma zalophidermidis]|uniref:hypothetical protein n=1 Tax=Mycoplasma zalophidermidis TaxID=398174 RepID=UPI001C113BFF|nr:hypothetical protein [Mycoplasma zalophidermidis]MBU4689696.1 hypothetical protein [Mycoplasma zalophidermidis]